MNASADERAIELALDPNNPWPEEDHSPPRAAVALIFRTGDVDTELLFIQRSTRQSDPWSGQMALPGGRRDAGDDTPNTTAERETREEVGLDLATARPLGALSELEGGIQTKRQIFVNAHAYWLDGVAPTLTYNYEVADAVWVPLRVLCDPSRHIDYYFPAADAAFPGIQLDESHQVVWGLTLRLLSDLFGRLELPFILPL